MIRIQRFRMYDLVAVVVILLLFFSLWTTQPMLSRSKAKATQSNCSAQLKQLGTAASIYMGDNNGNCPGPQPLGATIARVSWDRELAVYLGASLNGCDEPIARLTKIPPIGADKTLATFTCPADPLRKGARMIPEVPGSFADGMASGPGICRSYVLNLGTGNLAGRNDGIVATATAIPSAKVISAAGTVFLIESHGYATVFGQANIANDTTIVCSSKGKLLPVDAFTNPLAPMHGHKANSRCNALMHDGHMELLEQATVVGNDGMVMQYSKDGDLPGPVAVVGGQVK